MWILLCSHQVLLYCGSINKKKSQKTGKNSNKNSMFWQNKKYKSKDMKLISYSDGMKIKCIILIRKIKLFNNMLTLSDFQLLT